MKCKEIHNQRLEIISAHYVTRQNKVPPQGSNRMAGQLACIYQ